MSNSRHTRILLVCPAKRNDVEQRLKSAGCAIIKVDDGVSAVARVRREMFDIAVLVSTGEAMDSMETIFNLKDIRRSMRIIVVRDAQIEHADLAIIPNVQ